MSRFLYSLLFPAFLIASPVHAASIGKNNELVWAGCGITKHAFMTELAKAYEKKSGIKINLQGGGATRGIRDAVKGEINIGGACRTAIDTIEEERGAYQIPVAWDALVVIVHSSNPVDSITFDQLKGIYLGKIKNWKELGGPDRPLELYIRQGKLSGVGRTLRELVFANFEQEFHGKYVEKSTGPLEKGVEENRNGIAVTGVSSAKRRKVKILQLEGHAPTYDNIKSGHYMLYRPLYLVAQKRQISDPRVKEFITFVLSDEGREIIRKMGTVPYADAMSLVMKQVEQYERAAKRGLYN
ncbi:MAG: phosphate ABC transporter substrate-binding protein [Gammaproteobacteria bacterium]|nr:phosphate ABC transporter substrate-binding protein [Gammaproteobacteria bacterium]MDH5651804.1 phosphate ABC transporter substrate-binding protein [Gammaproteobacteria bacterium]